MLPQLYSLIVFLVNVILYASLVCLAIVALVRVLVEPFKGVCTCKTDLHGKVALVTGGNSGIGLETARGLARHGARVIIASRNEDLSRQAVEDIVRTTGNDRVEHRRLDLSSFAEVRQFAAEFNRTEDRLHILVNNAGIGGVAPEITQDGVEIVMQVNYLSAFLLTNLLLDKVIASRPSRIVMVSSVGHRLCYFDPDDVAGRRVWGIWLKYANSKLCQLLWARALAKRVPKGVTVNCVHPGIVATNIFKHLPQLAQSCLKRTMEVAFKNSREGAQTSLHVCLSPHLENVSGEFFADCARRATSAQAADDKLIEKVWSESIRLTQCN